MEVIIQNFIEQYGLFSVFMIVLLEYANVPIPSEVVLPLVGIIVSSGALGIQEAIVVSLMGGIVGSVLNYYIGYYLGNPLIKKIVKVNPKLQKSVNSSMLYIDKYGEMSIMLSRIVPLIRTFISIPAGITKMKKRKFVLYSAIGILVWNTALIYLGYICGNNLDLIASILGKYSIGMMILMVVVVTITYILVKKSKKEEKITKMF